MKLIRLFVAFSLPSLLKAGLERTGFLPTPGAFLLPQRFRRQSPCLFNGIGRESRGQFTFEALRGDASRPAFLRNSKAAYKLQRASVSSIIATRFFCGIATLANRILRESSGLIISHQGRNR